MQPKLKENPKDWLKFTTAVALVLMLVVGGMARRGVLSRSAMWGFLAALLVTLLLCLLKPRLCRGFYRVGMTVSFYIGQVIGRILLTLIFLLVVTPLGILLRLCGKDLLRLKRDPTAKTYWEPVKQTHNLDREF
jgi:F0F1-type ATP synthase assembly protein I